MAKRHKKSKGNPFAKKDYAPGSVSEEGRDNDVPRTQQRSGERSAKTRGRKHASSESRGPGKRKGTRKLKRGGKRR